MIGFATSASSGAFSETPLGRLGLDHVTQRPPLPQLEALDIGKRKAEAPSDGDPVQEPVDAPLGA
ncbi:MAG: hypothetical protein D6683_17855 [Actinomyces sp.]|nr:MAG: hypothetical protein D6683_17855 [Actinomyces sp.]